MKIKTNNKLLLAFISCALVLGFKSVTNFQVKADSVDSSSDAVEITNGADFANTINNATDGLFVKLMNDISFSEKIIVPEDCFVTVDLNDHTIFYTSNASNNIGAELTSTLMMQNGTWSGTFDTDDSASGTIILNHFKQILPEGENDLTSDGKDCNPKGVIFAGKTKMWIVNGCEIHRIATEQGAINPGADTLNPWEANHIDSSVAEEYVAKKQPYNFENPAPAIVGSESTWEVKATLNEDFTRAQEGGDTYSKVILLKNAELTENATLNAADKTFDLAGHTLTLGDYSFSVTNNSGNNIIRNGNIVGDIDFSVGTGNVEISRLSMSGNLTNNAHTITVNGGHYGAITTNTGKIYLKNGYFSGSYSGDKYTVLGGYYVNQPIDTQLFLGSEVSDFVVVEKSITYNYTVFETQPTKDNDYTVALNDTIEGASFQWYKKEATSILADDSVVTYVIYGTPVSNGVVQTVYDEDEGGDVIALQLDSEIASEGTIITFKSNAEVSTYYNKIGEVTNLGGGNYSYVVHNFEDCFYFAVVANEEASLNEISIETVAFVPISGETNAKLSNTTLDNTEYYCKTYKDGVLIKTSNSITPNAVSFTCETEGATGDNPDTIYQLEGRTVELPAVPYSKDGYVFTGWSLTNNGDTLTSFTMGGEDVTLYASCKNSVNLTLAKEEYHIDTTKEYGYLIDSELTGFVIKYYVNNTWTDSAPQNIGIYNVLITRDADDTYSEYTSGILEGYYSIYGLVKYEMDKATGGTPIESEKFYAYMDEDFDPIKVTLATSDFTRTGYEFDGWIVFWSGVPVNHKPGEKINKDNGDVIIYPDWKVNLDTISYEDNDYTVNDISTIEGISNVSYEWGYYGDRKFSSCPETDEYGTTVGYLFASGSIDKTTNSIIPARVEEDNISGVELYYVGGNNNILKFKYSGTATVTTMVAGAEDLVEITKNENGYYYINPFVSSTYQVYFVIINDLDAILTDVYLTNNLVAADGETGRQLQNVINDSEYVCAVSYTYTIANITLSKIAYSNGVTPKRISFVGGDDATGTAPNNMYQLEGRTITLPNNPFTKTDSIAIGWKVLNTAYDVGSSYTVGSNNVEFVSNFKELETVSITEDSQSYTYGDSNIEFLVKGTELTGFTVKYYVDDEWTENVPSAPGNYNVKITRDADSTYKALNLEIEEGLIINKITVTVTFGQQEFTYTGSNLNTSFTASYVNKDSETVSLRINTCTLFKGMAKDLGNIDDAIDVGLYVVWFTFNSTDESDIYKLSANSDFFTVKKGNAAITVDTTQITKTYGETITLPTATTNFGTVTCDKTVAELTTVGTYTVTYTVEGTNNYNGDTKTLTVKINPAKVTAPAEDTTVYVYTGSEQTYALATSDLYTITGTVKATNAGEYDIYVSLNDKANYTWADGTTNDLYYLFSIDKKEPVITVDTTPITKAYGEVLVLPTATSDFGTVTCNKTEADLVNVGEYFVAYLVDGDDNHYGSCVEIVVRITKANAAITVDTTQITKTYGEELVLPTATTNFGTVTCDKTVAELTNVGTYTVTYTVEGTNNYNGDTKTLTVKINPAKVTAPAEDTTVYVYTGSEQTYALATSDLYTITGTVKATNAGEYDIYVSLNDKTNYTWADGTTNDLSFAFTIVKANASITVDTTTISVIEGTIVTLPTATTNFGAVTCDKTSSQLTSVGTYTVTYTVEGTDNYNGDTKTLTVVIKAKAIDNKPEGETIPNVTIETEDGFDPNIVVEVKVEVVAGNVEEGSTLTIDYNTQLAKNETLSGVYDVKLLLNGIEIPVSNLGQNATITVKMLVPSELVGKTFRIIHVHDDSDITEISLGEEAGIGTYIIENGYLVTKIDRLSEFAFIEVHKGLSVGAIIGIVFASLFGLLLLIYILGYFFCYRRGYLDDSFIKVIYVWLPRGEKNKEDSKDNKEEAKEQ